MEDKIEESKKKSRTWDLDKEIPGVSLNIYRQYINIVLMKQFDGKPTNMALSVHKDPHPQYKDKEAPKPTWITFDSLEALERLIQANLKGYVEMMASRQYTEEMIKDNLKKIFPQEIAESIPKKLDKKKVLKDLDMWDKKPSIWDKFVSIFKYDREKEDNKQT